MTGNLYNRRAALAWLLALPMFDASLTQPQPGTSSDYRRLREPVVVTNPVDLWSPVLFEAWLDLEPQDGLAMSELLLYGMLLRVPGTDGDVLRAFCTLCPHEMCQVDLLLDVRNVTVEGPMTPDHPLLFCVCHESAFDPTIGGARIAGPTPRGLFRFELESEALGVRITGIEESLLARLNELL